MNLTRRTWAIIWISALALLTVAVVAWPDSGPPSKETCQRWRDEGRDGFQACIQEWREGQDWYAGQSK